MRSLLPLLLTIVATAGHTQPAPSPEVLSGRITAMAEIPSSAAPVYSPDGKRIAFLSNRSGSVQVWVADADGGPPTQVTRLDDPVASLDWSPVEDVIAYAVSRGGGYKAQVFIGKPDGSEARRISSGGEEENSGVFFSPDGRYWFESNLRDPSAQDTWVHDPATGKAAMAIRFEGLGGVNDIQKPANRALISRVVTRGNNNLYLHDLATGSEQLLTPHDGAAQAGGVLAPDGSAAYVVNDLYSDRLVLSRIPIDAAGIAGKPEPFAARDDADVEDFVISRDGRTAILTWNANGRSELERVSLPDGQRSPLPAAPGELVRAVRFSPDGSRIVLVSFGSKVPAGVWQHEFQGGRYLPVAPVTPEGVDLASLVSPELRKYKARDGLELSGWLYLPKDFRQPGPVVLSFHGGPEGQEIPGFRADYQAILAQGIAVFAPNIRGSAGFGKAFREMDNREKRFDANRDILDTASHIVESGIGRKGRLGIIGGSYGGYAVMVGVTEFPDTFAAGVDMFGIVNFETFFSQSTPWMGAVSGGEYGDPKTQLDVLRRLSPIHKLDRVKAAMLVMHGANDTNVPLVEAQQVVDTLKKNGRDVEFLLFPDEGHGWRKIPNRVKSTVTLAEFFRRHLVEDDPAPDSVAPAR